MLAAPKDKVDLEEEVKLKPEVHKSPPKQPRTGKNELRIKPPVVRQLPNDKRVSPFAASGAPPPAINKFIGTMSIPANEEPRRPPPEKW
jgi:hypothetical protein